jgi:GrpB-like predicted nucleotidyltransferase (UPF0157 family)
MADLGLQSGTVVLAEYNVNWPKLYEIEAKELTQILGVSPTSIKHVGSTSIPGMVAKPILDIAILVDSLEVAEDWKPMLEKIGYWYKGIEADLPDRRFFAKGPRSNRTVYLHIVNQKEFDSLLKFRDTLRAKPKLVKEYSDLKQTLAAAHTDDRDTYTRSKNSFIQKVLSG